jgi:hypothetical protein
VAPILFSRLLQALAGLIEAPAMVRASKSVGFGNPEGKICAPVRAQTVNKPQCATAILIENEIFAQQSNRLDRVLI